MTIDTTLTLDEALHSAHQEGKKVYKIWYVPKELAGLALEPEHWVVAYIAAKSYAGAKREFWLINAHGEDIVNQIELVDEVPVEELS